MTVLWVAIAVTLDGAAALVGGLLPDPWLSRHRAGLLGFAVGALVAAAALDLAPEAFELAGTAAVPWLAGGFVAMAVIEVSLHAHGHAKPRSMRRSRSSSKGAATRSRAKSEAATSSPIAETSRLLSSSSSYASA